MAPLFRKPPLALPKPKPSSPRLGHYVGDHPTPSGVYKALESTRHKMKIGTVLGGIITAGAIAGGTLAGINTVQAQVDAGVKATNERVTLVRDDLAQHKAEEAARHDRQEAKTDRLDQKVELILDALRVPMSKRPEPTDAGK